MLASVTIDVDGNAARRQRDLLRASDGGRSLQQGLAGILEVEISYSLGNGNQVTQTATVTMRPSETVYAVHFEDIPHSAIVAVSALSPDGGFGSASFESGVQSEVFLALESIGDVSSVLNFDFFDGSSEGWKLSGPKDSFVVVPHVEEMTSDNLFERDASGGDDADAFRLLTDSNETDVSDYDLIVSSNKYAATEVSASYTFDATGSEVQVRYKFVADVISSVGSASKEEDDFYRVSIRSKGGTSDPHFIETKSISGLGASGFDPVTGSTPWMIATVSNITGVTEVIGMVGKAGKSSYQSHLYIDYVEDL